MIFREELTLKYLGVFLVFCLSSINNFGQSYENKRFKIGFSTSFDYCFRNISYAGENSIQEITFNAAQENETWRLGFSSGINASYRVSKLISIESGLLYSRKGYRYKDELIYGPQDPRFGFVTNSTEQFYLIMKYAFNYFDIPLKCNFNVGLGQHNLIFGAGLVNSFLINSWKNGMLVGSVNGKTSQSRVPVGIPVYRYSFAPLVNSGIDFQISQKSSLRIDLNAQYQLKRLYNDFLNYNLWSAGLNFTYFTTIGKN